MPPAGDHVAADHEAADHDAAERDARDLRRSLTINLLGYAIKFATPFLLILVIRSYGAGPYGVYALAHATLMVLVPGVLLGFDKALLWWIPRQRDADALVAVKPALLWTLVLSTALAAATALGLAPLMAGWAKRPDITDSLRWMAITLVPMALLEVVTQAAVARRFLEAHVIYREGITSLLTPVLALLFYAAGMVESGLALSLLISYVVALAAVMMVFRRAFRAATWHGPRWRVPPEVWRFAWPMWLSEAASAVFRRLDVFVLAWLTDDVTVGLFVGAAYYAQNITAIRVSFDPMVMAMVSEIDHARDMGRLRRGFSHAWSLVAMLQLPLMAFMIPAAAWIVPLLGEEYGASVDASLVLIGLYAVHGLFGLNQHIVTGFGRSRIVLGNTIASLAIGFVLLTIFIEYLPPYGVTGAAVGIGLTYVSLNVLWALEARALVGGWHYGRVIGQTLLLAAAAGVASAAAFFGLAAALPATTVADLGARVVALLVFAAVYVPGALRLRKTAPG